MTAHYSYPYPRWDETDDERDKRLETSYEYTRTYPVTLIYTDAGWRFDAFTTPNQADMQLLGEWDGVEETDSVDIGCSEWMSVSTTVKLRCNVVQRKWVQEGGNILQGCSRL